MISLEHQKQDRIMDGGQGTCPVSAVHRATTTAEKDFRWEFVEILFVALISTNHCSPKNKVS